MPLKVVSLSDRVASLSLRPKRVRVSEVRAGPQVQHQLGHQLKLQSNPSQPQHHPPQPLPLHPNPKKKLWPEILVPPLKRLTSMIHQDNLCRRTSHTNSESEQPPFNSTSILLTSSHSSNLKVTRKSWPLSSRKRESRESRNRTESIN